MHVAVIGVGGVGGFFGGKICRAIPREKNLQVTFVARNEHLAAIRENGLLLDCDEGELICKPTRITDTIREIENPELILVCVKSYDLPEVITKLAPLVSENSMILPLLNGVDIYERIRSEIKNGIVFP